MTADSLRADRRFPGPLASLAFFTRIGVPHADPHRAMLWAPVAGLAVAVAASVAAAACGWLTSSPWESLLVAAVAVAFSAYLTRGLHLDGLADTCDALGARLPPAESVAVMHRSDVGPFGVVALNLTVLLQVAALAALASRGLAWLGLAIALPAGRMAAMCLCTPAHSPAPQSRLGAWVSGAVPRRQAVAVLLAVAACSGLAAGAATASLLGAAVGLAAVGGALMVSQQLGRMSQARFGGITGDALGATVEAGQTLALLIVALGLT